MRQRCGDDGVSEVVAAVLLVGLTVLGVAIVAAIFLSSPQPDEIPHAAIVAGNRSGNFALTHEGGDSLKVGEYRIYAGAGGELQDVTDKFTEPPGGMWSIGETLVYSGPVPERVIVVSRGTETILSEPTFVWGGKVFDPDPVVPGEPEEPEVPVEPEVPFIDFVINENVFVYGSALKYNGDAIAGQGATIIITGNLNSTTFNEGASIAVSRIYIDGDVTLGKGSASLGSETDPGYIYINGDLTLNTGYRDIHGNVYVNGNCDLEGANIHNNVYVNGDLTLRRSDTYLVGDAHIYYTGTLTPLNNVNPDTLAKCIPWEEVPGFIMPDLKIPSVKSPTWYKEKDYILDPIAPLTSNMKIFAPSYTSDGWKPEATNIIIIAYDTDISITGGGLEITGVLFAPKGSVTFSGNSFEGVVIARDGFYVTSGGTDVTFKNIQEYISDPEDYPF
ncbi:MAG: type IV pilin N-terminal domain-containing protein [Methanoculleus sp.]